MKTTKPKVLYWIQETSEPSIYKIIQNTCVVAMLTAQRRIDGVNVGGGMRHRDRRNWWATFP